MATTLQNLIDATRIEVRDPDGITFQDPDIIYNVNQAYRLTYQDVVNELQDNCVVPVTMTLTANVGVYALPANCLRLKKVEVVYQNIVTPIKRYRRGWEANFTGGVYYGSPSFVDFTYDIEGDNLLLEPTPGITLANGLLLHIYPVPTQLVAPTDIINTGFKDVWIDVLVLRAARACFAQLEASGGYVAPQLLQERLEDSEKKMFKSISLRTLSPEKKRRKGFFQ